MLRTDGVVVKSLIKETNLLKHTCIYAHYNSTGKINQYVFTYLEALHALTIQIIFVSNSAINADSRTRLQQRLPGTIIMERINKGFDFGAWQHAILRNLISEDTTHLILTNDSIFGPLFDLRELISEMSLKPGIDFWGLTDSYQGQYHIQSFFVCLSKQVFTSRAFTEFFSQDFNSCSKLEIITKGELQFTSALLECGFISDVLAKAKDFDTQVEVYPTFAKNPTHAYWKRLIVEYKFPFIKKELILFNPDNLESVEEVFETMESFTGYQLENIKEFLIGAYETKSMDHTGPSIVVLCHLFYPHTIYYFLLKLSEVKACRAVFIFNLSAALRNDRHFIEILIAAFPGSIILCSPSQGRDIGGKLVALDAMLKADITADYALIIHDKLSLHSPLGIHWRNKLFSIISEENLVKVFEKFENNSDAGIVAAKGLIQNEYNPDENNFSCTSSKNILNYIREYDLRLTSYQFVAGTIFWVRTTLLRSFFSKHAPLTVRLSLEKGNVLDFAHGTNIHAWERIFSFIGNTENYKIKEL